jgi:cytochrome d ubiquinol oxidase subunit II
VPALLFGVAVGNVLLGVPFYLTEDLFSVYDGSFYGKFLGLLRPFALLAGVVSLAMLLMHGAAWLSLKAEGAVAARARRYGTVAGLVAFAGYALAGVWLGFGIDGYRIVGEVVRDGPSNPLFSDVERGGSWLAAYAERPWIVVAPVMGFLGILLAVAGLRAGREVSTLLWSKMAITGIIASVGLTMFPFILPSTVDPSSSLTVWDSSSSHLTLFVMLVATAIFMPLILAYTAWVYKVLWGKVTEEDVTGPGHSY